MPKKPQQDNRQRRRKVKASQAPVSRHISSIGEILARGVVGGASRTQPIDANKILSDLRPLLDGALAAALVSVEREQDCLKVAVRGAAWAARARYAVALALPALAARHPGITRCAVRVAR